MKNAEIKFLIYCIETYKSARNLTGKQIIALFDKYGVIAYIVNCYGALHTMGDNYIVEDIDSFIEIRKSEI
ncbi:hypothetical protein FACS189465_0670 [Clostridia bacterium]|nr:hypothetical protein FACS189465_0670 [Clostridia bacterium]